MIELRDLKQVLDNVVVEDSAEWEVSEESNGLFNGWKVEIKQFQSDRVRQKIDEINQKISYRYYSKKLKVKKRLSRLSLSAMKGWKPSNG